MGGQPSTEDILLGRIALSSGLITRERLDECIHIFETSQDAKTLSAVFLDRGYLTKQQLKNLESLVKREDPVVPGMPAAPAGMSESAFFGKLAIREGLVTAEQVFQCLEEQVELEKSGKSRQLGEIMVDKGILKLGDVSRLLKLQKKVVMRCPNCATNYTVAEEVAERERTCQRCRAPLEVVKRLTTASSETVTVKGAADTIIGKIFTGCQVIERIGRGGMATVYKGKHLGLNKMMAIKILTLSVRDPASIDRFVKEARSCAKLEHPNIIQVYNVGQKFGFTFILMQYVQGHTLAEVLDHRQKITVGSAIKIVREVAKALGYAHDHDIVHRDVKPDNIFVTVDGEVKIGDFGLAVETKTRESTDTISGTPYYMPPEAWKGDAPDGRSDIYSLGVTFYMLVTGRKPYEGEGPIMLMEQHLHEKPKPPTAYDATLPRGVSAVIMKMIAKKPADRYQTVTDLLNDLEKVESGREPEAAYAPEDMPVCRFCRSRNMPSAKKCSVCGEYLGEKFDVLMMDNEFQCPGCKGVVSQGERMCGACGMVFCKTCGTNPAEQGTAYCKAHQPPPPPPGGHGKPPPSTGGGKMPHRPVRRH